MNLQVCVCIYIYRYMYFYVYIFSCMYIYRYTVHTYFYRFLHTYIHTYMHTYIHYMHTRTQTHACIPNLAQRDPSTMVEVRLRAGTAATPAYGVHVPAPDLSEVTQSQAGTEKPTQVRGLRMSHGPDSSKGRD